MPGRQQLSSAVAVASLVAAALTCGGGCGNSAAAPPAAITAPLMPKIQHVPHLADARTFDDSDPEATLLGLAETKLPPSGEADHNPRDRARRAGRLVARYMCRFRRAVDEELNAVSEEGRHLPHDIGEALERVARSDCPDKAGVAAWSAIASDSGGATAGQLELMSLLLKNDPKDGPGMVFMSDWELLAYAQAWQGAYAAMSWRPDSGVPAADVERILARSAELGRKLLSNDPGPLVRAVVAKCEGAWGVKASGRARQEQTMSSIGELRPGPQKELADKLRGLVEHKLGGDVAADPAACEEASKIVAAATGLKKLLFKRS